jgi:hypothetical protein
MRLSRSCSALLDARLPALIGVLFLCACSQLTIETEGGGTRGGNPVVVGTLMNRDGTAASNATLQIVPERFNPITDGRLSDSLTTTTDADGKFSFHLSDSGVYTFQAVNFSDHTRLLLTGISVKKDSIATITGTLMKTGTVVISLFQFPRSTQEYVYVPGTTIFRQIGEADFLRNFIVFDSLPAGSPFPLRSIIQSVNGRDFLIADSVRCIPDGTVSVAVTAWKFSKRLVLNTTAAGAQVAGNVYGFPMLVRLTSSNFNFTETRSDGGDIRFAKPDSTPLPYEIERWDNAGGAAEIWVKADTVYGNDSTHFIMMYWGNPDATDASDGAAVFDTADGFQGVWHLGEPQGALSRDATLNHYNGTPSDTAPAGAAGVIDGAMAFDGVSNHIQMNDTKSGKLNFPQDGFYTISAWVFVNELNNRQQMIVSKDNQRQYHLQLKLNNWQFTVFIDSSGWESAEAPATVNEWSYVVGVRNGSSSSLYVNGVRMDSVDTVTSALQLPRNTSYDVTIGKISQNPDSSTFHFNGTIDEVRMSNVSRGPDWIRLCYMNQKAIDKLIVFK